MASDSSNEIIPTSQLNVAQHDVTQLNEVSLNDAQLNAIFKDAQRSGIKPTGRYVIKAPSNQNQNSPAAPGGPQKNRLGSGPESQQLQPIPRPTLKLLEPWRAWVELTVKVANLPPNITTWDLWERFSQEGTVIFIEIFDDRQGQRDGNARIRFSPPPRRAFWVSDAIRLSTPDGNGEFQVRAVPEPRKRRFEVQSPIKKSIWYPETLSLSPSSVAFGFMYGPNTMMKMQSAQSHHSHNDTTFKIDLLRSRLVVTFQLSFKDPRTNPQLTAAYTHPGELDRTNTFMFTIPFGQLQNIDRVQISESHWALVISLDSPPQFFRKRLDPRASHTKEALTWSDFDTWFRQTDIVYDPRRLENVVVSLRKELPVLDIGRWTTYYFLFEKNRDDPSVFQMMKGALQDHNVEVTNRQDFEIVPGTPAPIWSVLDPQTSNHMTPEMKVNLNHHISEYALPFEVRYQLEVCITQGIMNEHNITTGFISRLADMARKDQRKARYILEYAAEKEKRIYDPMTLFDNAEALAYSPNSQIPHYCAYSRKATVTPTTLYFSSPTVETTNRVIRKFTEDRFLRVQFTDEKFEGRISSCADKARNDEIFTRVYRTLLNGIRLGDRHYQFLAFGNSQFRENGAYFFCPTERLTCDSIRHWMGDFRSIKVVAKYAARLGLCFSTTRAIHSCRTTVTRIEDIERNGYCFTDGVGKISDFLSSKIAFELNQPRSNPSPSAFQFRMGGAKGMLVNWPGLQGDEIVLRSSQEKFTAIYNGLEVIRCSGYSPATLNRQTITILSSLGVPDEVFNRMLSEQLSNYQAAMTDRHLALDLLGRYIDENHVTVAIARLVEDGFMDVKEPFLLSLLHLWRAWSIKQLKEKAKIIVEDGAFLLGVTDETGTLRGYKKATGKEGDPIDINELPQVFIQVQDRKKKGRYVVIDGPCLVGRNPSLFPGDIRLVQAVNIPALHHLRDVVVFSQLGDRDVPSMCSGGDLDGDDFFCIWDQALVPPECNAEPMNFTAAKPKELDRPVEIKDVIKFFVRFMKNDTLPTIAHAHLAQSDYLDLGVKDPKCVELAELHSKAVDYVKSGEPAQMPKHLKPRQWPHFMEKKHKPKEQIYVSAKILGQLYDKVDSVDFVPQYEAPFDERILGAFELDSIILKAARQLKTEYDTAVRRLMAQHEIKTEFEVWSTFVLSKPRVGSDYKMQEDMGNVADALKDRFRRACIRAAGGAGSEQLQPFVAAMYQVTHEEMLIALKKCRDTKTVGGKEVPMLKMEPRYMPLMSFPWLFDDTLGRIAQGMQNREDLESLGIPLLSTQNETGKPPEAAVGREESESDYVVETAGGIFHRGDHLHRLAPDDVDSEGDEVEQPFQVPNLTTPADTSDESNESNKSKPLQEEDSARRVETDVGELSAADEISVESNLMASSPQSDPSNTPKLSEMFSFLDQTRSFSPSMAELAVLEGLFETPPPEPRPRHIDMAAVDRKPSDIKATPRSPPRDYLGEKSMSIVEELVQELVEEEVLFEEEESPWEKLSRLQGSR